MKTRTGKALGTIAGIAAFAAALPLAGAAAADPPQIPDPQGPGCDAFKTEVPNWRDLNNHDVGTVLANIPDISTFNALISGQVNPNANIIGVLNNGPYVVFAPSNEAFAAMPPGALDALKESGTEALTKFGYYHASLGMLGPDTVQGQRPTQDGAQVKVVGKGGDLVVNDTARVICGGIQASNARIYIIDGVLDPAQAPAPIAPAGGTGPTDPAADPVAESPAS